jgi:hypothetical protein
VERILRSGHRTFVFWERCGYSPGVENDADQFAHLDPIARIVVAVEAVAVEAAFHTMASRPCNYACGHVGVADDVGIAVALGAGSRILRSSTVVVVVAAACAVGTLGALGGTEGAVVACEHRTLGGQGDNSAVACAHAVAVAVGGNSAAAALGDSCGNGAAAAAAAAFDHSPGNVARRVEMVAVGAVGVLRSGYPAHLVHLVLAGAVAVAVVQLVHRELSQYYSISN